MTSRTVTTGFTQAATSDLFSSRLANQFSTSGKVNNASASMPDPNSPTPLNEDGGPRPEGGTAAGARPPSGMCNFHNTEYAINQRYRYNTACHKNLRTLQQTIGEKKRPCLFDAARIFGGSECSREVFNGICSFHWSMMNLRVGVCEQYNTHNKAAGSFQHYEMLVDVAIPDRSLVPIFPDISDRTSMWDLLFGFTYATNRGLLTTKVNEGAAMAYALYYMMDNHCYVEFLARSTYWVQNMTEYLMAFVFYNDELQKDVYASRFPADQGADGGAAGGQHCSVLKNLFAKNVHVQQLTFDVDTPRIRLPEAVQARLTEKDARLVSNLPPMSAGADVEPGAERVSSGRSAHTSRPYKHFHVFVAPLILSLRPSSYVTDMFVYGAPPVIGVFNIRFRDTPAGNDRAGHAVFAIQGPVQYGVATARGNRNLPFVNGGGGGGGAGGGMPVCTQAYVATLGAVSNVDVTEDRIFASELASYADFNIADSDQLFSVNALR